MQPTKHRFLACGEPGQSSCTQPIARARANSACPISSHRHSTLSLWAQKSGPGLRPVWACRAAGSCSPSDGDPTACLVPCRVILPAGGRPTLLSHPRAAVAAASRAITAASVPTAYGSSGSAKLHLPELRAAFAGARLRRGVLDGALRWSPVPARMAPTEARRTRPVRTGGDLPATAPTGRIGKELVRQGQRGRSGPNPRARRRRGRRRPPRLST